MKTYPPNPLLLTGAWTEDATGIPASDFTAGEVIQYHGSGASDSAQPVEAVLSWMVDGTCGLTGLYTDTGRLDSRTDPNRSRLLRRAGLYLPGQLSRPPVGHGYPVYRHQPGDGDCAS
jgi:hypothetical protein